MDKTNKLWRWVWIIIGIPILIAIILWPDKQEPYVKALPDKPFPEKGEVVVTYNAEEYDIAFDMLFSWGGVNDLPGNPTCPEEDTYRTPDTLNVYEQEIGFQDIVLPKSESFIRSGVRFHRIDPKNLNTCGDEFLLKLARREFEGEALSSFRLTKIEAPQFLVSYENDSASRLDTEGRKQFTYLTRFEPDGKLLVVQFYMSFVPVFGSPELKEIEEKYGGDITTYMSNGRSAEPIREFEEDFQNMSETFRFIGE